VIIIRSILILLNRPQVPVGLSPTDRLPLGIQIVAPRGADALSIAVAVELEKGGIAGWARVGGEDSNGEQS
jgi:Asp-tRNA(Asn)/Glu-tRNA(Gln) amidotransferase A subunit family amidase